MTAAEGGPPRTRLASPFGHDPDPVKPLPTTIAGTECQPAPPDPVVTARIVEFLRGIGLEVVTGEIDEPTALPGIKVDRGVLVLDPARLRFPGDLLHEAGHLAVKPPAERRQATADLGSDPAEEMMAIAWSYAAVLQLQLPPAVVFHPAGYAGGAQSLLENFAAGRYLAVPMLQWIGLTYDAQRAEDNGVAPYPRMRTWLRPG